MEYDSFITGRWETFVTISSGGNSDSLSVKMNLTGKDGKFSGEGEVKYCSKNENSTTRCNFNDDASGSYSESEMSVTLVSSISGNSYSFSGTRVTSTSSTVSFDGKVTLLIDDDTVEFENITLFKNN